MYVCIHKSQHVFATVFPSRWFVWLFKCFKQGNNHMYWTLNASVGDIFQTGHDLVQHTRLPVFTSCATIMADMMASCQVFEVTVHTSPGPTCGTFNCLWLNLIGSRGETPPISVTDGDHHLLPGSVSFSPFPVWHSTETGQLANIQVSPNSLIPSEKKTKVKYWV